MPQKYFKNISLFKTVFFFCTFQGMYVACYVGKQLNFEKWMDIRIISNFFDFIQSEIVIDIVGIKFLEKGQ